jgi:hypothetical protein
MTRNNNNNEKYNKNNTNQNKWSNENSNNNMEIKGLKTPGQDSNPPSNISLNSNKNGNKDINSNNSHQPIGLITPSGDKNDNKNQIRCIKCNAPLNNQDIQVCKVCFKKEIIDCCYSSFYDNIKNNRPINLEGKIVISIKNNIGQIIKNYNLEEALKEYNEIFRNENLDKKSIIYELKKTICISCKNKIKDKTFELPCKCHFCCKEELDIYINNLDLSRDIVCLCGQSYPREMLTQLAILTVQLGLKSQKKLKEHFKNRLLYKCCICGKTNNIQIYFNDLVSSIGKKDNNIDNFLSKLVHYFCKNCYESYKNIGFNCLICKIKHFIPNQNNK